MRHYAGFLQIGSLFCVILPSFITVIAILESVYLQIDYISKSHYGYAL